MQLLKSDEIRCSLSHETSAHLQCLSFLIVKTRGDAVHKSDEVLLTPLAPESTEKRFLLT